MSGDPTKLVAMANQIATFFATQAPEGRAAEVAGHLKAFWEPRMLSAFQAHVEAGGAGLSPLALEAALLLRTA